jgi:uncharacterized phage protein (TIGR02218 family)
MSFGATEISAASAQPIELYTFVGTNTTWRITSSQNEITSNGQTFSPLAVQRNAIKISTNEESDSSIEISLPVSHPIVDEYAFKVAPPSLFVTIERCHQNDPDDTVTMWYGPVISYSVQKRIAKLKVPDQFTYLLRNTIPRARYQAPCNHVLFDTRCGVNSASYRNDQTVVAISENEIELNASPFSNGDCDGGMMVFSAGSESRMIKANTGVNFTVSYPFATLEVGDTVTVYQGCDHSYTTCKSKFSNGQNFGGFPFVPTRNPFTTKI